MLILCGVALPLAAAELPDGPGKAIIERECSACHETSHITGHRSRDEWIDTVSTMMDRGASLTGTEFDTVIGYLMKNFGKEEEKKVGSGDGRGRRNLR